MSDRRNGRRASLLVIGLALALGLGGRSVLAHGDEDHDHPPTDDPGLLGSPVPSTMPIASLSPGASPSPRTSAIPLASLDPGRLEASGVVISVDSPALGRVDGFVLLTTEGAQLSFDTSSLAFDPVFPVSHIAEHQMTSDPVRVTYMVESDRLVVLALADAQ